MGLNRRRLPFERLPRLEREEYELDQTIGFRQQHKGADTEPGPVSRIEGIDSSPKQVSHVQKERQRQDDLPPCFPPAEQADDRQTGEGQWDRHWGTIKLIQPGHRLSFVSGT